MERAGKKKSQVSSALGDDCMNLLKTLSKGIYSCNVAFEPAHVHVSVHAHFIMSPAGGLEM